MTRRYRINRKHGALMREVPAKTWDRDWVLKGVILHATPPTRAVFGGEFERDDTWVGLCFLDLTEGPPDIGYVLLNNGKTGALKRLLEYRTIQKDLLGVTTHLTVSRESSQKTGNSWYKYRFNPKPLEVDTLTVLKGLLANNPNLLCVDPVIRAEIRFPDGPTVKQVAETLEARALEARLVKHISPLEGVEVNGTVNAIIWDCD